MRGERGQDGTVVYLDVLAAVNLAMDYLLLAATARLAGVWVSRLRLLAGAALGAAYAAASIFPGLDWLALPPVWALAGLGMVCAAFGRRGMAVTVRLALLFYLVSCACAGGALALGAARSVRLTAGGGYYLDVPLRVVAAAGAVCWVLTGLIFRGQAGAAAHGGERVRLTFAGRETELYLRVDSGNDLCDPVSGQPVLVLTRKAAARVLPAEAAAPLAGLRADNAAAVMAALPEKWRGRFRLLPYRAVGQTGGLLLAFRPDRVERNGRAWPAYAAISAELPAGGGYEGLIGA